LKRLYKKYLLSVLNKVKFSAIKLISNPKKIFLLDGWRGVALVAARHQLQYDLQRQTELITLKSPHNVLKIPTYYVYCI